MLAKTLWGFDLLRNAGGLKLARAAVHRHIGNDPWPSVDVSAARELDPFGMAIHEHKAVAARVARRLVRVAVHVLGRVLRVLDAGHHVAPERLAGIVIGVAV